MHIIVRVPSAQAAIEMIAKECERRSGNLSGRASSVRLKRDERDLKERANELTIMAEWLREITVVEETDAIDFDAPRNNTVVEETDAIDFDAPRNNSGGGN